MFLSTGIILLMLIQKCQFLTKQIFNITFSSMTLNSLYEKKKVKTKTVAVEAENSSNSTLQIESKEAVLTTTAMPWWAQINKRRRKRPSSTPAPSPQPSSDSLPAPPSETVVRYSQELPEDVKRYNYCFVTLGF